MNDKDLADRIVAFGVVEAIDGFYYFRDKLFDRTEALTATQTARDPRVAMALMERCWSVDIYREDDRYDVEAWTRSGPEFGRAHLYEGQNESLPRAIIEACVKALEAR